MKWGGRGGGGSYLRRKNLSPFLKGFRKVIKELASIFEMFKEGKGRICSHFLKGFMKVTSSMKKFSPF